MKKLVFCLLASFIFIGSRCQDADKVYMDKSMRHDQNFQVVQILLDSLGGDVSKDEKFVVFISSMGMFQIHGLRPTSILAWFKYRSDHEFITVNYFSMPFYNRFEDQFYMESRNNSDPSPWLRNMNERAKFIKRIIENKGIANMEQAKQTVLPLPFELMDDTLFNKMKRVQRRTLGKYSFFDESTLYTWGFKTDKIEFIRHSHHYEGHLYNEIRSMWYHIDYAISDIETPDEWREESEKCEKMGKSAYGRQLRQKEKEEAEKTMKEPQ